MHMKYLHTLIEEKQQQISNNSKKNLNQDICISINKNNDIHDVNIIKDKEILNNSNNNILNISNNEILNNKKEKNINQKENTLILNPIFISETKYNNEIFELEINDNNNLENNYLNNDKDEPLPKKKVIFIFLKLLYY